MLNKVNYVILFSLLLTLNIIDKFAIADRNFTPFPCVSIVDFNNIFPANIYLFKFNSTSSRKRCEICSKLTIKTPEQR